MKLLLASANEHKISEFKDIIILFGKDIDLITLADVSNEKFEVIEDGKNLEENSFKKAKAYFDKFQIPTVADDTGLEVYCLGNLPGVHSARFAGEHCDDKDNREKLINMLNKCDSVEWFARFRTSICFYDGVEAKYYDGICSGKVINEERGDNGFGYDSLFIPDGYDKSFAELDPEIKNKISHRRRAIDAFIKKI
jgi:XTP/dITP diphosphohydrolase